MPPVDFTSADGVATITLASAPVNALTVPIVEALIAALQRAGADPDVRAVLIQSAFPRYFCAGLDLVELQDRTPEQVRTVLEALYLRLWEAQRDVGKPVIAVVSGAARGGGLTLALSCNIILAGQGATFGYSEIDVGLLPAIHLFLLPRLVGRHRAYELMFTARPFGADEAYGLGLVSRVVPDADLPAAALDLAQTLTAKPPAALAAGHAALADILHRDWPRDHAEAVEIFCRTATSQEARAAMAAFIAQRRAKSAGS